MKNVTKVLTEEHNKIKEFISTVLDQCISLEKRNKMDISYFKKVVNFIKKYADEYHHSKEEDILFKSLENCMYNMHCNPVPVMLYEHETGREFVRGIEDGLEENDLHKVISNTRGYCGLLIEHIHKEDEILYPMAEEALSEFQKDEILKKYEEVKNDKFEDMNVKEYLFSEEVNS